MGSRQLAWVLLILWLLLVALLLTATLTHAWELHVPEACPNVPSELVHAIIAVESAGDPYVLNVGIGPVWRAYRFDNRTDAAVFLQSALQVTQRIDIGLMQINIGVWGKHINTTAAELLEVATNLRVGCGILAHELAGGGPLWRRIGRYHSRTPARNAAYALKIIKATLDKKE